MGHTFKERSCPHVNGRTINSFLPTPTIVLIGQPAAWPLRNIEAGVEKAVSDVMDQIMTEAIDQLTWKILEYLAVAVFVFILLTYAAIKLINKICSKEAQLA